MHNVHVQVLRACTGKSLVAYRALHVYASCMIDEPAIVPGPQLAEARRGYGVSRRDLADRLRVHRNTLRAWETAHSVDVIRARRYSTALREIVDERTAA